MSHMGEIIPSQYVPVINAVSKLAAQGRKVATSDDLLEIVKKDQPANAPSIVSPLSLSEDQTHRLLDRSLTMMNAWGDCVYFSEGKSSGIVYLSLQYLTKQVIAKLLDPVLSRASAGCIEHSALALNMLGRESTSADERVLTEAYTMLLKFDACFCDPYHDNKQFVEQKSIVPSLLPGRDPIKLEAQWSSQLNLAEFQQEMSWFIQLRPVAPRDLFARLMCKFFQEVAQSNGVQITKYYVWKNGLVATLYGQRILVTHSENSIHVNIRVPVASESVNTVKQREFCSSAAAKVIGIFQEVSRSFKGVTHQAWTIVRVAAGEGGVCFFKIPSPSDAQVKCELCGLLKSRSCVLEAAGFLPTRQSEMSMFMR